MKNLLPDKSKWPWLLTAALLAGVFAFHLYLRIYLPQTVASIDEAPHLARIFAYAENQVHGKADPETDQPVSWPPTVHRLAARWWVLTGYSHTALHLMWIAFFILFLVGAFALAREMAGPWAGLLAALFTAGMPLSGKYAVTITLEMPLAAATVWAMWTLVKARGMRAIGWASAFGVMAGLACFAKGYAPAYLAPPALYVLFFGGPPSDFNKSGYRNPLLNAAIGAALGAMLISSWYGGHIKELLNEMTRAVQSANDAALTGSLTFDALLLPTVLFFIGVFTAWPHRKQIPGVPETTIWAMGAAIVFASAPERYAQLLFPAQAAAGALAAAGIFKLPFTELRKGLLAGLIGFFLVIIPSPFFLLGSKAPYPLYLSEAAGTELTRGPLVVLDPGGRPDIPAGALGYLLRLRDGQVDLTVADSDTDSDVKIAGALTSLTRVSEVLTIKSSLPGESPLELSGFRPQTTETIGDDPISRYIEVWRRESPGLATSP